MANRPETWESGVTRYLEKLEQKIDAGLSGINSRIDTLYSQEIGALKERIVKLETRVSIYAAIAGFVGMAIGGSLVKFIVK